MSANAVPIACTLSADDLRARLQRIDDLSRQHLVSQEHRGREVRLMYGHAAGGELREIVGLERECCGFLEFVLDEQPAGLQLTIRAPEAAGDSARFLFEHFMAPTTEVAARAGCKAACGCSSRARV